MSKRLALRRGLVGVTEKKRKALFVFDDCNVEAEMQSFAGVLELLSKRRL